MQLCALQRMGALGYFCHGSVVCNAPTPMSSFSSAFPGISLLIGVFQLPSELCPDGVVHGPCQMTWSYSQWRHNGSSYRQVSSCGGLGHSGL